MDFRDVLCLRGFATYAARHPWEMCASVGPTLSEVTFGLLGSSFKPERDFRNLEGKVVLVTGGNTGLGKETILKLAEHNPARIYLAARNECKAREAIRSIQASLSSPADIRFLPLDLASFTSIRAAADKFQTDCDRLDLLILNAGTMGNPPTTTEDGFEVQLGTNHVGHFLLTKLLLPTLQQTVDREKATGLDPDVRVITLASLAHTIAPSSLEGMTSTPGLLASSTWTRYGASKAANILFASELARRHPEILSVAVHPGTVNSDLYEHARRVDAMTKYSVGVMLLFFRNVSSGALNQLWAAGVSKEKLVNGAYYTPVGYRTSGTTVVRDADLARELWDWTEEQVAAHTDSKAL
ncbi:hypothetical protein N7474_006197 [Penicillium riverlandense]|uniref:uncharacterized protein n=1 Tax=Penicillium riverlandense TaxID=1903569 RepID=UPI0025470D2C|nr:uncharacterized protein N7474_006197 [Penicillium riverlandense]KAJ5820606.1 hypothetical protein N7474_006197 [Penicillium riverlandense]